jgi:hypothetical protein
MLRRHQHSLVPAAVRNRNLGGVGGALTATGELVTDVLFRCSDGCTCPTSFRVLRLAGSWALSDLIRTEISEKALIDERLAEVMAGKQPA